MKKRFFILLCAFLLFGLVGCDSIIINTTTPSNTTTKTAQVTTSSTSSAKKDTTTNAQVTTKSSETTIKTDSPVTQGSETTTFRTTMTYTTGVSTVFTTVTEEGEFSIETPVTDKATIQRMKSYYLAFDFSKVKTTSCETLIYYIKSFMMSGFQRDGGYAGLKTSLPKTDRYPNTPSGKLVSFYSHQLMDAPWAGGDVGTWNREHVYPKSTGGFSEDDQVGFDLHHLRACDNKSNGTRGNNGYGEVSNGTEVRTTAGNLAGWNKYGTFEPVDVSKGDAARIIMYVGVAYYKEHDNISHTRIFSNAKTALDWNKLDPVDEMEMLRNNYAQDVQKTRNIFLDFPSIADYIWG
jgi:endonuclease I